MPVVTEENNCRIVSVSLADRSYDIVIGEALLGSVGQSTSDWLDERLGSHPSPKALIITDSNVRRYANLVDEGFRARGWTTSLHEITPGEKSKQLETVAAAWQAMVDMKADRRTVVVAVGGGVVGDMAGFVGATFARGVPFVQVPTTLLADVDSSVGGKVGINLPQAKNLVGAFHQPIGVVIDLRALESLPDREYRAGLAEVIKYGVILDQEFFEYLERNSAEVNARDPQILRYAISRSCELKAQVVEKDEFERSGLRAVLNYGHTFAHAFEALTGYGELLHGEAVSIGMVLASQLAERLGRIDSTVTERQVELLDRVQLPVSLKTSKSVTIDAVLDRMLLDKKTVGGKLRFVLPTGLGHVELVDDVPVQDVRAILSESGLS